MPSPNGKSSALVVIGLSAGGLDPLRAVLAGLDPEIDAPVLVAVHVSPESPGVLDEVLRRDTRLGVSYARDGDDLQPGHIYLAPPNNHLAIRDGVVRVQKGPRYNGYRPSIDRLFLSAVGSGHAPLVGVLLSGARSDGTAGARALREAGGHVIVQDPATAALPSMIQSAQRMDAVDEVLAPADIPAAIARHLAESPAVLPAPSAVRGHSHPSTLTCPDCGGVLSEEGAGTDRFACQVGHGWSLEGLVDAAPKRTEDALWTALEILEEQLSLDERLLKRAQDSPDRGPAVDRITARIRARRAAADQIRSVLAQA